MSAPWPITLTGVEVRRRGQRLLGPVDLTLTDGGPTMILGPNGAGKTSLLRVLHGIERISAGRVDRPDGAAAQQAYVFQAPTMLRRSVAANLAYPLVLRRMPRAEIARRVALWLNRSGLKALADLSALRLSGGERQKLAVARALISDPGILFLDEPCASLDGAATREIEALLQEAAAAGTRIVMVTHDLGQARRLAADVVFLVNGRIAEAGQTCLSAPQTPELQGFLRGDIVT